MPVIAPIENISKIDKNCGFECVCVCVLFFVPALHGMMKIDEAQSTPTWYHQVERPPPSKVAAEQASHEWNIL